MCESIEMLNSFYVELSSEYKDTLEEEFKKRNVSYILKEEYLDEEGRNTIYEITIPLFVDKQEFWNDISKSLRKTIYGLPRIVESLNI